MRDLRLLWITIKQSWRNRFELKEQLYIRIYQWYLKKKIGFFEFILEVLNGK